VDHFACFARAAYRFNYGPFNRLNVYGFRLARSLP
jgi:formylglycine-generating enzyme required for sulfatase activity